MWYNTNMKNEDNNTYYIVSKATGIILHAGTRQEIVDTLPVIWGRNQLCFLATHNPCHVKNYVCASKR